MSALAQRIFREPPIQSADHDLITAAQNGSSEAFAALVTRYERSVYHLAVRTLGDREEAKDATQEAFMKAFRSLRTFRAGAKFSTWIFAIAYHACCDRLAKNKRRSLEPIPERASLEPGPSEQIAASEEAQILRAAVQALPEKYRTVITLYHLQGKHYDEIATVLGVPMGTVKTHLFRAKELLRKRLTEVER